MSYRNGLHNQTLPHYRPRPVRVGARGMAILLGFAALTLLAVSVLVLSSLIPAAPAASSRAASASQDHSQAVAAIQQHLSSSDSERMIEIADGVFARQSNVNGISVNGTTYYYAIAGHQSFDPLSLQKVSMGDVEIVHRTQGAFPLVIYYLRGDPM